MIIKLLSILAIVCVVTAAENNNNKPSPEEDHEQGRGRQFPIFNTEGTVLPPSPVPGYQDDGLQGPFNPYSSPQLGYPGFYPNIQPQQPQGYPIQPQIIYYSGAGQPFLVNPGNPPGNFLVPQPIPQPAQPPVDPNIFRTQPGGYPQNPVFIGGGGGYPKQPHIPPIDKDAEEIPKTTPQQANPTSVPGSKKPQKIELDESEDEPSTKPNQIPTINPTQSNIPVRNFLNLRPGQRFFILNGQPLFSNYPHLGFQNQGYAPERISQPYIVRPSAPQNFYPHPQQHQQQQADIPQQSFKPIGPLANLILRNQPQVLQQYLVPQQFKGQNFPQQPNGLPLTLHNQVIDKSLQSVVLAPAATTKESLQSRYYEKGLPLDHEQQGQPIFDAGLNGGIQYDYYKYADEGADDAAIIIDAKYQEPNEVEADDVEGETEKPAESSVAEAQPGAIALAGVGGVAAAGPRGTALAGEGGLAVSSPHATAVAGPSKDDPLPDAKSKKTTTKTKQ